MAIPTFPSLGQVLQDSVPELEGIRVDERLGAAVPGDLRLVDQGAETTTIASWFGDGKPVVLVLYYSDCPMLCSLVLNGLSNAVRRVGLVPGTDYRIVTVSINPDETVERVRMSQERFAGGFPSETRATAWRFYKSDSLDIARLSDAVGFRFRRVPSTGEFAHPAVVMVLTPEGTVSRYLYGIDYQPRDLRLALVEASRGKVGSAGDKLILYCFHYDPDAKGYKLMARNLMKLGGVAMLAVVVGMLGLMWVRELTGAKT